MIDKIEVTETLQRFDRDVRVMSVGLKAADALLWFEQYAQGSECQVVDITARLIASSTPKVETAQRYVSEAAKRFESQILEAAIAAAQHDFSMAEIASKRRR